MEAALYEESQCVLRPEVHVGQKTSELAEPVHFVRRLRYLGQRGVRGLTTLAVHTQLRETFARWTDGSGGCTIPANKMPTCYDYSLSSVKYGSVPPGHDRVKFSLFGDFIRDQLGK